MRSGPWTDGRLNSPPPLPVTYTSVPPAADPPRRLVHLVLIGLGLGVVLALALWGLAAVTPCQVYV